MGIASSGIFAYAGVLLWQYKKSGVWWGFGSIGIAVLSGLIQTFVVASALSDLDETLGEAAAGFGLILVGIQAVCCSMVVALPLLMNGADLD
jgi:hypothetical protein